jgi:hypothetical protein
LLYFAFASCKLDFVNTAARLAVAAARQGDSILTSEEVFKGTSAAQLGGHQLALVPAGVVKMKGKRGMANVFRLEAVASCSESASLMGQAAPVTMPLVGRGKELFLLQQVLTGVGAPRVVLICIEGGAGAGKSAFVDSLVRAARDSGRCCLLLRAAEAATAKAPFSTCRSVLRWMLEQQGELDADRLSWLLVCALLISCHHAGSTLMLPVSLLFDVF